MKLYVIRHGLTNANKLGIINGQTIDEPLEPEGVEQVKQAVATLPAGISRIYSSDMLRTRQTTDILNQSLNVETSFHPEFREIHYGDLSGKSWADIQAQYGENLKESYNNQSYDFTPYNGESIGMAQARVQKMLQEIKSNHADDDVVLVVAHGGIMRLLSHLYVDEHYESTANASVKTFDI